MSEIGCDELSASVKLPANVTTVPGSAPSAKPVNLPAAHAAGSIGSIAHMLSDQQQASESIAKSLTEIARLAAQNEKDSRAAAATCKPAKAKDDDARKVQALAALLGRLAPSEIEAVVGFSAAEWVGKDLWPERLHPEDRDRVLREAFRVLKPGGRAAIISSIEEQGKMTPVLLEAITHAEDKTRLEDLYLPYRVKRRTKAQIALETGLGVLAEALLASVPPQEHDH